MSSNAQIKFIYRVGTAALLLSLAGSPAEAGHECHGGKHEGKHEGKIAKMIESLGLDAATQTKIKGVVAASKKSAEPIRAKADAERAKLKELMHQDQPEEAAVMAQAEKVWQHKLTLKKLRLKTMLQIRAMLTPEQRQKLLELKEKKFGEREKRHGKGCGCDHGHDD